ncbi:MAG: PD-(D/E)XK nuclease family protein, partial [Candidatus Omnitrophota bacterium]
QRPSISSQLDHCYAIYQLACTQAPEILIGRKAFWQFLPWAKEILHFIEQLDLEDVPLDALSLIQAHAQIGYSVPDDINHLLKHLCLLRKGYHEYLDRRFLTTRGYQYLRAARQVGVADLSTFTEILFCNFFYLHTTENTVLKNIYDRKPTVLFMQGDQRRWPALKRIAKTFGSPVMEGKEVILTKFDLKVYEAFDSHAQAGLVKEILSTGLDAQETVVVLPNVGSLLPLLTAMGGNLKEFNISMGYPLKRSGLYALLELMIQAQLTRKEDLYYTRDYLKLLQHPLLKNLNLIDDSALMRALVHRIEEALKGDFITDISGALFIDLERILKDGKFWEDLEDSQKLQQSLQMIHNIFLKNFQVVQNAGDLAKSLGDFVVFMQTHSSMEQFPLNHQIAYRLQQVAEELGVCIFKEEEFNPRELFRILQERLSMEMVAFSGSPLRGLQVLGLFETRALNFKNVIIVDVNEGMLPNLSIYEPLIPREVLIRLSLDRLELEEEIQRYGFMRLISAAKNVHLIYQYNTDKVRSRFVEELIWEQERNQGRIGVIDIIRPVFEASVEKKDRSIPKTKDIMDFLKGMTYSASSLNTYLRNPYEFYQNYVLGLREQDNLLDEPDAKHMGTFVHGFLEDVFKSFINRKPLLDSEFKRYFFKVMETRFEETFGRRQSSDAFLIKTVLETRFERFFEAEAKRCDKDVETLIALERKFDDLIELNGKKIKLTYRMDRLDKLLDGSILVLDYKTGGSDLMPKAFDKLIEGVLSRELIRENLLSFQMPLYLYYLRKLYPDSFVNAALYHLRTNTVEKFVKSNDVDTADKGINAGLKALDFIIGEILNPQVPFVDDPHVEGRS